MEICYLVPPLQTGSSSFLAEQVLLLSKSRLARRYSVEMILAAFAIYFLPPRAYEFLRELQLVLRPPECLGSSLPLLIASLLLDLNVLVF